jgi:hypothetical protein
VVAILRDNLKRTKISNSVGKVESSVGLWIKSEIKSIKSAEVKEIIRKKSSIHFGNGTIIIASIEKINATSTYSFLNKISL